MSRFNAAMEAWLRAIRSATIAGSVSIGSAGGAERAARGAAGRRPAGALVGSDGMKSPRSRMVCSASPISGSPFPMTARRPARLAGEARARVTSTNSRPPASAMGRGVVICQNGEPQGLHGVGHHLPVTDGDVDVVLAVARLRDREQRGDRPALDDLEAIVDQAPFDVLGTAEMRLDPPAELHQPHDLRVRQGRLPLPLRLDRLFPRSARRRGDDGKLLGGDRLVDDLAVPHRVAVRVHQAGDQGLAEAEAGLHGGDLAVARDRVGREQDAGRLREDHLLHDHGHLDLAVVHAVPQAVGHGPLGEERGPAAADVLEDRRRPDDVQVRVLLAREGGRRQVLGRGAGADGAGGTARRAWPAIG